MDHPATHYEKIQGILTPLALDQATRLAGRCRQGDRWIVGPLVDHVAAMIVRCQEAGTERRAKEQLYREALVPFWATVQVARAMTAHGTPYRFQNCCEAGYDEFVVASACSNDPQGLNMQAQLCWHLAMHEACGRKVYQVSPGLGLKLSLVELRGLTTDLLRLPFEAIYIQVPEEADLWVHNVETDWHRCQGIYCVEDPQDLDGDRCWRIMAVGEPKSQERFGPTGLMLADDALIHFRIKLRPGRKLEHEIRDTIEAMERDVARSSPRFRGMMDEWPHVFRWLMNVVIYCTWPDVAPIDCWANDEARRLWEKVQRGDRGAAKKLAHLDPRARTVLGHTIVVDRSLPRRQGPGATTGRELAIRQRVAGHLKRVWCGPGKTEWKIARVDPYFRGPDAGEVSNATRRLK